MGKTVTLAMVKANPAFSRLIEAANNNLEVMGYTEHGIRHVGYVSRTTANILKEIGCDEAQGFWFSPPVPLAQYEEQMYGAGA